MEPIRTTSGPIRITCGKGGGCETSSSSTDKHLPK